MHIIIWKFSFIYFARICKVILSFSFKLAINKITLVVATIKFEFAMACFFTFLEWPSISYLTFVPCFGTLTMLLVVEPLSFIHRSFNVNKYSKTISFAIFPISLINISVSMSHPAFSIEQFSLCHSLIKWTIWKFYLSKACPLCPIFIPIASVSFFGISRSVLCPIIVPEHVFATVFYKLCKFFLRQECFIIWISFQIRLAQI